LSGPTSVPNGGVAHFTGTFLYTGAPQNPVAIIDGSIFATPNLVFAGASALNNGNKGIIVFDGSTLLLHGEMNDPTKPLVFNFDFTASGSGVFFVDGSSSVPLGGDSTQDDDFPQASGVILNAGN